MGSHITQHNHNYLQKSFYFSIVYMFYFIIAVILLYIFLVRDHLVMMSYFCGCEILYYVERAER